MALTPPTPSEFLVFLNEDEYPTDSAESYAPVVLQQATDLMTMATGRRSDPTDETDDRIMDMGIMAMAQALASRSVDRAREYSPFSSERLGSYSYQKAAVQAMKGHGTGVELFDAAVQWLTSTSAVDGDPDITLQAEEVFRTPEEQYKRQLDTIRPEVLNDPALSFFPD